MQTSINNDAMGLPYPILALNSRLTPQRYPLSAASDREATTDLNVDAFRLALLAVLSLCRPAKDRSRQNSSNPMLAEFPKHGMIG